MRTYQPAGNHTQATPLALPALRRDRPAAAGLGGPVTVHYTMGAGHDYSQMRIHDDYRAGSGLDATGQQSRRVKGTELLPR